MVGRKRERERDGAQSQTKGGLFLLFCSSTTTPWWYIQRARQTLEGCSVISSSSSSSLSSLYSFFFLPPSFFPARRGGGETRGVINKAEQKGWPFSYLFLFQISFFLRSFCFAMGLWKRSLAAVVLSLLLVGVWADAGVEGDAAVEHQSAAAASEEDVSGLRLELEQLRSKISNLESNIAEKIRELKSKDESIVQLEKILADKSANILALQGEIESIQKKGVVDAEELVGRVRAKAEEHEKQVVELRKAIDIHSRRKDALVSQAREAEKKVEELDSKLETLRKTNDEQKHKIRKTERALKVAEEELVKVRSEAKDKIQELSEVHGAWLPPWLFARISHFQKLAATYWNEHGQPALDIALQKASEKSVQAQKWAEPHVEKAKTIWLPALKERWVIFVTNIQPYVKTLRTKSIEAYRASKDTLTPHIVKVQELANPYLEEVKKFSQPYVDQIATITKPHVEKLHVALKPYRKHVVRAYRKTLKSASAYHHQVQAGIQENLKKHELTKHLATKELVSFMASVLLVLPIFLLYRLLTAIFGNKKPTRPTRNTHANHGHRRPKRRHTDK